MTPATTIPHYMAQLSPTFVDIGLARGGGSH